MALGDWYARNHKRARTGDAPEPQVHPPFVYVWGVPDVPKHLAGLQPFSEELAAYLATYHNVTTYKFDNLNPHMPYFVPVATPLDTLASLAAARATPPHVERQNAHRF